MNSEKEIESHGLRGEKSPYLKLHAHDPVRWVPFSKSAFAEARRSNRPVFLSSGYFACHWCHVMHRETFQDPEIARILNESFICIKMDREEMPQVDSYYIKSLQMTGAQGGWPMNVFLDGDGRLFTGGTYFPPEATGNLPSFRQVLDTVMDYWHNKKENIENVASEINTRLQPSLEQGGGVIYTVSAANTLAVAEKEFDKKFGGFNNNGTNKFPPSMLLSFLLQHHAITGESLPLEIVKVTLENTQNGGIYDHIGGGIFRYTTDLQWQHPHFEKMLYDNAFFARTLVNAYDVTADESYKETAIDIFNFIDRELTSKQGTFYSSLDADSNGVEGGAYIIDAKSVASLTADLKNSEEFTPLLIELWNLQDTIPHNPARNFSIKNFCSQKNLDETKFRKFLQSARENLLRRHPSLPPSGRDEKVVTAWNSWMISSLTAAARSFNNSELHDRARNAAQFFLSNMVDERGLLYRRFIDGEARFTGSLQDQSAFALALIDLYRTDFDSNWIKEAAKLAGLIETYYSSDLGAYYETADFDSDLPVRIIEAYDGTEASGNSQTASLFYQLSLLGIEIHRYTDNVSKIIRYFSKHLEKYGIGLPVLLQVQGQMYSSPSEIALVNCGDDNGRQMLEYFQNQHHHHFHQGQQNQNQE